LIPIPPELNHISEQVIGASIKVHSHLGPGLLESVYEACLMHEMQTRGLEVRNQVALPVTYDNVHLDAGYRIDLLVENRVIIELKSVEKVTPLHEAQLLTYLKLSNLRLGLLINFNVLLLKDGIRRMVI